MTLVEVYPDNSVLLSLYMMRNSMTVTRYKTSREVAVEKTPDAILTSRQAARLLNVSITTLRRWTNKGMLRCYRIGPRGDRIFTKRDIERFMRSDSSVIKH